MHHLLAADARNLLSLELTDIRLRELDGAMVLLAAGAGGGVGGASAARSHGDHTREEQGEQEEERSR